CICGDRTRHCACGHYADTAKSYGPRTEPSRYRELPTPATGNRITYDSVVTGLGVRVTKAGARSFVFNYRTKSDGRERRLTIGKCAIKGTKDGWSLSAARKRAAEMRLRVD